MEETPKHFVYQTDVVEFMTIVAQTCLFFEQSGQRSREDLVDKLLKLLPLLYLKAQLVSTPERCLSGESQRFVSEDDYNQVQNDLLRLLEPDDTYLDMQESENTFGEEPVQRSIAEDLADIYQELKDLAGNYQSGDEDTMNDAVADCMDAFREHWGTKLLSALRALHQINLGVFK